MAATIPENMTDLLTEPIYATVGTVTPDGQPHLTVVWVDYDGENVIFNTAKGRQKHKNMLKNPKVTVMARDPETPWRWLEVRGKVTIEDDADLSHINSMAKKYMGKDEYYGGVAPAEQKGQEERIICKVKPDKVTTFDQT